MPIDMSLAQAPPSRGRKATTITRQSQTKADKRAEGIGGLFQLGQFGLLAAKQYADAAAIGEHAGNITSEVVKLAESNDKVAKAVDYLIDVGPYAGLIAAVAPLIMQVAANHKLVDASKMPGVSDPEIMGKRMEIQARTAAMEQMKALEHERREYAIAEQEFDEFMAQEPSQNGHAPE